MNSVKTYIRDKRSPHPKNENVSKVMSKNKPKNTKPEMLFRQALFKSGIRGYRIHKKDVPGKPDIVFFRRKIAIFINGCFWHRCPKCDYPLPKTNQQFWKIKFDANVNRDQVNIDKLTKLGWKVIVIWECEILKELELIVKELYDIYKEGKY